MNINEAIEMLQNRVKEDPTFGEKILFVSRDSEYGYAYAIEADGLYDCADEIWRKDDEGQLQPKKDVPGVYFY